MTTIVLQKFDVEGRFTALFNGPCQSPFHVNGLVKPPKTIGLVMWAKSNTTNTGSESSGLSNVYIIVGFRSSDVENPTSLSRPIKSYRRHPIGLCLWKKKKQKDMDALNKRLKFNITVTLNHLRQKI